MSVAVTGFAAANDGQTASASSLAVTVPATASVGDVGVFFALTGSVGATFTTVPSGWTSLVGPNTSNTVTQIFVKDLTSGEPGASVTWTSSASNRLIGLMVTYSGTSASRVSAVTPTLSTTATSSLVEPSVTTTVASSYVAGFWGMRVATAAPSPTLTYPGTETFDGRSRTAFIASSNYTVEASHLTTPGVAGSYGGTTATSSASTSNQNLYAVVIAPIVTTSSTVAAAGVGAATLDGSVGESAALAAAGVAAASAAGSVTEVGALAAAGSGAATVDAAVTELGALAAAAVGAAGIDGSVAGLGALAAAGAGGAAVDAAVVESGALTAAAVGAATAGVAVSASGALAASAVGAASADGSVTISVALGAAGVAGASVGGFTTYLAALTAAGVAAATATGSFATHPAALAAAGVGGAVVVAQQSSGFGTAPFGTAPFPDDDVAVATVTAAGVGSATITGLATKFGGLTATGIGAASVAGRQTWFAALTAAGVGAATAAGPAATYLIPDTIPFDGTGTGVVAAINSWLAGLPNGSTAQFQPNGIYKQGNQPVQLTDRSDFTLDFNGATLVADADYAGSLRPAVRVTGGSNVQVKNLTVQGRLTFLGPYTSGYTSADEWQHGVHFKGHNGGGTRANVTGCTINNVYGDGVACDPDDRSGDVNTWVPTTNILVQNSTIDGCGRHGASVTYGDGIIFQDLTIGHVNWWVFDLETDPAQEYTNNITIRRITSGPLRFGLVSIGGGTSNLATNITIHDCVMTAQSPTCQAPITALGPLGVTPHRTGVTVYSNTLLCYQMAGSFTRHDNITWVANAATSTAGNGGCGHDYHVGLVDVIGAYLAGNSHPNTSALYNASGTTSGVIVGGVQVGALTAAGVGSATVAGSTTASTASGAVSAAGVGAASIAATFIRSGALTAVGVGGAVVVDQQSPGFGTAPFGTSPFGGDAPPTGDGFGLQPFGTSPFGGAITAALLAAGVATATVNVSGTKTGGLAAAGAGAATVASVVSHPGGLTAVGVATATVGGTVTVTAGLVANGVASAVLADTGLVVGRLTAAGVGSATVTGLATKFGGLTATGVASATVAGHIPSDFRDITLTVGPLRFRVLTATLRGGPVDMSRLDRTYVEFDVTVTLPDGTTTTVTSPSVALLPIPFTPAAAVTWTPTTVTDGVGTVLIAGPDADPVGAVVLPGPRSALYLRDVDNPEVQAVPVGRINLY